MKSRYFVLSLFVMIFSANASEPVRENPSSTSIKFQIVSRESSDAPLNHWARYSVMLSSKQIPNREELKNVADQCTRSKRGGGYKLTVFMYLPGMRPGEESAYAVARYSPDGKMISAVDVIDLGSEQRARVLSAMKKVNKGRLPANQ